MMGWFGNDWNAAGAVGMLMMLAVWVTIVAAAVWAVARFTRSDRSFTAQVESPRAILDRRFATGDIDAEGYAQARRILDGRGSAPVTSPPA